MRTRQIYLVFATTVPTAHQVVRVKNKQHCIEWSQNQLKNEQLHPHKTSVIELILFLVFVLLSQQCVIQNFLD